MHTILLFYPSCQWLLCEGFGIMDGWTGMMDGVRGRVDGLKCPFQEQTRGKTQARLKALTNFCHIHMFPHHSIIHVYLPVNIWACTYLHIRFSSKRNRCFYVCKSNNLCIFVQIICKSMDAVVLIYNLVNQHAGGFILNHWFRLLAWTEGGRGGIYTEPRRLQPIMKNQELGGREIE